MQDTMPCACGKTLVRIGEASDGGELVKLYYHCKKCQAQVTVDAKTGNAVPGRFLPATLNFFFEQGILNEVGLPGRRYPHSLLPMDK